MHKSCRVFSDMVKAACYEVLLLVVVSVVNLVYIGLNSEQIANNGFLSIHQATFSDMLAKIYSVITSGIPKTK